MIEHKVCKGCRWNNYPLCKGTKMFDGNSMNIERLSGNFQCGQRDKENMEDFSIRGKSELELRIEVLEAAKKEA